MLYLSIPYSSPDAATRTRRVTQARVEMASFMKDGHVTVCPVAMNHEAIELMDANCVPRGDYWRELETQLAQICDELVVITEPGWRESRGVAREIAIFEAQGKPVRYVISTTGRSVPIADIGDPRS